MEACGIVEGNRDKILLRILGDGFVVGMALLDENDFDINQIPTPQTLTMRDKMMKCESLEGRLRSGSWGLLEVRTGGRDRCLCGQFGAQDSRVDTPVESLQRTVFGLLEGPSAWRLDCLSTVKDDFPSWALLSVLYPDWPRGVFSTTTSTVSISIGSLIRYSSMRYGPIA